MENEPKVHTVHSDEQLTGFQIVHHKQVALICIYVKGIRRGPLMLSRCVQVALYDLECEMMY